MEHEDNATVMGHSAGRSMAGEPVSYDYLPYFYSDLFDLSYEALGILDSQMEMVSEWDSPFEKGVVYYLSEGHIRGILLWNVSGKLNMARDLFDSHQPIPLREFTERNP